MKKTLFLFATAAIALASCSSDDTIAENMGLNAANEISFRPFVANATRAADITTSNLDAFKAYATKTSGGAVYFGEEVFTKQTDNTYTSTNKHYWPAEGALDFFAYAPSGTNSQLSSHTDNSLTFTVTPSATVGEQVDLVVANTDNKTKGELYDPNDVYNTTSESKTSKYGANGIPLNFRHTGSKVVVNFKNTQAHLNILVQAFKIVNVDGTAIYAYNATNTDGNNSAQLPVGNWSDNTTYSAAYTVTPEATNTVAKNTTSALYLQNDGAPSATVNAAEEMILIPQTTPNATTAYSSTSENAAYSGSYIAVKMTIKNDDTDETVVANATADNKWAMWPVKFTWLPGKKYTYIVDLGDGGYWEKNNDTDADLDPILEGAEIKFVTVTVDDWDDGGNTTIGNMTFFKGGTYTENIANAAGTYYITIIGLNAANTIEVTNGTPASSTVGASGSVTITVPVTAGTATTNVTVVEKNGDDAVSNTTISLVQPIP